jgi:hypothetical protein
VGGTVFRREQKAQLSAKSSHSTRAKYLALGEEPFFNESQILALVEGVAPTPNGGACRDGKRAFGESQGRLSAHVRQEDPVKLSAKSASPAGLQRVAFAESFLSAEPSTSGKVPSPRGSQLSAKTPNTVVLACFLVLF